MSDFLIRAMQEPDIPPLARFVAQNYSPNFAEQFLTEARCAFMPFPFKPFFITAEANGVPIGCACYMSDWSSWGVFNLSWVQVAKSHQGQGIGRALVERCLSEMESFASLVILATSKPEYYARHWKFKNLMSYPSNEGETYQLMGLIMSGHQQERKPSAVER